MIGWLIAAGLVGAALASNSDNSTDYGSRVPSSHKRCNRCGYSNVSVYVQEGTERYVKLLFECRNCGRRWTKTYWY